MAKNVIVLGSVNRDHVYSLDHIVCPGETVTSHGLNINWGGKGLNQAISLAKAGQKVKLAAAAAGSDYDGLAKLAQENGLDISLVKKTDTMTGHAVIQVASDGQNSIIVSPGANSEIDSAYIDSVIDSMNDDDVILLQNEISYIDNDGMAVSSDPYIIGKASAKGIKVVLNPSPVSDEMREWPLDKVSTIILNETEGHAITGETVPDKILDFFTRRYPKMKVVLTLGSDGSFCLSDGHVSHAEAYKVKAVDTTAAGDTFLGYFICAVMSGMTDGDALDLASRASAIAVTRKGAAVSVPRYDEVARYRFD